MADEKDLRIRELELDLREARMALHDFAQMWSARRDGVYTRERLRLKIDKLRAVHRVACEAARIQAEGGDGGIH